MAYRRSLALVLLFAAACQRETSTDTSAPPAPVAAAPREVCGMLTMDELNTAAGLKDAPGQSSKSGDADVCTWTGSGGSTVTVQVFNSAAAFDSLRTAEAQEVTGIGDRAFYIPSTGTLVVAKGSTPVSVQITGGGGTAEARKGGATAIAHVILSKV